MKKLKWALIALTAVGFLMAGLVISKCDYENYCHDHGIKPDTETNPLTALYGVAVAIPAAGAAFRIERRETDD